MILLLNSINDYIIYNIFIDLVKNGIRKGFYFG